MFVVRRTFRNYNVMLPPGSVVEPGCIKRFKTRLKDRDIVEVNDRNFAQWSKYFEGKFGVSLNKQAATANEPDVTEEPEAADEPEVEKPKVEVKRVTVTI